MMFSLSTPATPTKPARPRAPSHGTAPASQAAAPISTDSSTGDAVARTAISLEYASLRHPGHCPLGMYLIPSHDSLLVWDAVFFVHQGYYTDCILKFRLVFPSNYPDRPPTVQFLTDVFHPLISQTDGVFNIWPRFRSWRPREHHVFDILHWVKAAFKKHALDEIKESDCLNKEAFRYHESTSSFAALATQSSMLSQSASALFDRDHPSMAGKGSHGIAFRELGQDQVDAMRSKVGLRAWDDGPNSM